MGRYNANHPPKPAIDPHLVSRAKEVEAHYQPKSYCLTPTSGTTCESCMEYDPKKFKESTSIVTYFPGGRLGNTITAYLTLYWVQLEYGIETYFEKESKERLEHYFENVNKHKVLEDDLCDWISFGFQKYEGNIDLLGNPEWRTGRAIEIYLRKENFLRHEIQGGRKFYKKYRKESFEALTLKEKFRNHAEVTLQQISKKTGFPA